MDLAWCQVALDEATGCLPPFLAETAVEKKWNKSPRKTARIGKNWHILESYAEDIDAGLEAIGKYAAVARVRSSRPSSIAMMMQVHPVRTVKPQSQLNPRLQARQW